MLTAKAELYFFGDNEYVAFVYMAGSLFVTDKIKSGRGLKEFIGASQAQLKGWAAGAAGFRAYNDLMVNERVLVATTHGKGLNVVDSEQWEKALKHFMVEVDP